MRRVKQAFFFNFKDIQKALQKKLDVPSKSGQKFNELLKWIFLKSF